MGLAEYSFLQILSFNIVTLKLSMLVRPAFSIIFQHTLFYHAYVPSLCTYALLPSTDKTVISKLFIFRELHNISYLKTDHAFLRSKGE